MNPDAADLLDIARTAVAIGTKLLVQSTPGHVSQKGDRDYVTDLDIRIQNEIETFLSTRTPTIKFLGEETASDQHSSGNDAQWVLDPIDGTANFVHGIPLSAISLALVRDDIPIIGVISAPFLAAEYFASTGHGAFLNESPIRTSRVRTLDTAIVSVGDYTVGHEAHQKNRRQIALSTAFADTVERVRMIGSAALDLAWVADGRTDACVILSHEPWDVAAGVVIAKEAGAVITDAAGQPHSISSAETVAITPGIVEELIGLVRSSGTGQPR